MWSPAPGSKLTLWFSIEGVTAFSEDGRGLYRHLTESLGFRNPKGEASVKIAVSSRRLPRVVELLPEAMEEYHATLRWLLTEPAPIPVDDQSWFRVVRAAEADNALKLREGVQFGFIQLGKECGGANVFVASDKFLAVVREHQLTGLESLPLPPEGTRPQTGWSQVFASRPMGRGLDHPAVDSELVEAAYGVEKGWSRRFGISRAWGEVLNIGRIGDASVVQLFRLGKGTIAGPDRFVREHTPDADFAYTGWGTSDGRSSASRWRRILFGRRARDVMVEAGLIKTLQFDPVLIIPAVEASNPILDRSILAPLPPPSYTPEELAAERARRETMLRAVPARAARAPLTSIGAARRAFAEVAKSHGVPVLSEEPSRLDEMRRSPLFDQLPRLWRELVPDLPITLPDPDDRRVDLWVAAAPRGVERPADGDLEDAPESEIPSEHDIVIGTNDFGDWYAVRADDPGLPHDASIKLWSHETLSVSGEWSSVLNFATYLVYSALDAIDEKP